MSQLDSLKINEIREKNIKKREEKLKVKSRKELSNRIKHEFIVKKNNFLRETNAELRLVLLKKREFNLTLTKERKLIQAKYNYEKTIYADLKNTINNYSDSLIAIEKKELEFYKSNYKAFSNAYALDRTYTLKNKIFNLLGQVSFLEKISDQFNTADKKKALEEQIELKNINYNEKFTAALSAYEKLNSKAIAKIEAKIAKIEANRTALLTKASTIDIKSRQQELDQKWQKFDQKAKINNEKLIEKNRHLIEKIVAKTDKKIAKINYKKDLAILTEEEAISKIDDLSITSAQLQRKPNHAIENSIIKTHQKRYELEVDLINERHERALTDFNKTKEVIAPIGFFKKLKVSVNDFMSQHIFGKSLSQYKKMISSSTRRYSMFIILAIILIIFSIVTNFKILSAPNIYLTLRQNSFVFIIAMGMLLVIVAGYIDLSAGMSYGFVAYLGLYFYNNILGNVFVTLLIMILIGLLIGSVTGVLVGYLKIPAFITTLAMMLIIRGSLSLFGNGVTLSIDNFSEWYQYVSGDIPDYAIGGKFWITIFLIFVAFGGLLAFTSWLSRSKAEKFNIPTEKFGVYLVKQILTVGISVLVGVWFAISEERMKLYVIYFLVATLIMFVITKNLSFGRKVYAVGGNRAAAELSGINPKSTSFFIFAVEGLFIGFAAFVYVGISYSATTSQGFGQELDVISAVFVGGASAYGGIGSVVGTFLGAFILSVIITGMNISGVNATVQFIIKGLILLGAVGYDVFSNRKIG